MGYPEQLNRHNAILREQLDLITTSYENQRKLTKELFQVLAQKFREQKRENPTTNVDKGMNLAYDAVIAEMKKCAAHF